MAWVLTNARSPTQGPTPPMTLYWDESGLGHAKSHQIKPDDGERARLRTVVNFYHLSNSRRQRVQAQTAEPTSTSTGSPWLPAGVGQVLACATNGLRTEPSRTATCQVIATAVRSLPSANSVRRKPPGSCRKRSSGQIRWLISPLVQRRSSYSRKRSHSPEKGDVFKHNKNI